MPTHSKRKRLYVERLEPRQVLAAAPLITEFMADNEQALRDAAGRSSDWIEIYNAGDAVADLTGWSLTDDARRLDKWSFPRMALAPGDFLVVFASGDGQPIATDSGAELHTNFRLDADGDYLALVDPNGQVRQSFSPEFPSQFDDISFGVAYDESGQVDPSRIGYFMPATPGAANGQVWLSVTRAAVAADPPSQTFVNGVRVTLTAETPNQPIYYTLDGSIPTEESLRYVAPLDIQKTVQVRSRVIESGSVPGPVTSHTYLHISAEVAESTSQIPIMVIDNFAAGAIPNAGWNQTNANIRQVARQSSAVMIFEPTGDGHSQMEVSNPQGQPDVAVRAGIRVRGAFSSTFSEPGYSLEIWDEGSDTDHNVSLLGMEPAADWVLYAPNPQYDQTLMDNTFMYEVQRQMGHWSPDARYVELYLNTGQGPITSRDHVGLYVVVERVERREGRIDIPRMSPDGSEGGWILEINRMDSISEDGELPKNFHTAGPNGVLSTARDLSDSSGVGDDIPRQYNAYINYEDPSPREITNAQRDAISDWFQEMEDVLYGRVPDVAWNDPDEGYAKYIDVGSFIDYLILNNLSHNGDGLLLSMWLYNPDPGGDGRLAFGPIWDVDLGSFSGTATAELMRNANRLWYGRLFQDPDFAQAYVERWHELRQDVLSDENMHSIIDSIYEEVGDQAARRDGVTNWSSRLRNMKNWLDARAAAIDDSGASRPTLMIGEQPVPRGTPLVFKADRGTVYFTLDGTDPRMPGGEISPSAMAYDQEAPLRLTADTMITARNKVSSRWSSLVTENVLVDNSQFHTDLDLDGVVGELDIETMCVAIRTADPLYDLTQDGQTDLIDMRTYLSAAFNTSFGDANLDGKFDSQDLVQVFIAARYERDTVTQWWGGDWNCDQHFTTADLVLALTENDYEPDAPVAAIAGHLTLDDANEPAWSLASAALACRVDDADLKTRKSRWMSEDNASS